MNKKSLKLEEWVKEVAPSRELRNWFRHDPEKWPQFQSRYYAALDTKPETWRPLLENAQKRDITLVYGARDRARNNAVALKEYLANKLRQSRNHPTHRSGRLRVKKLKESVRSS